MTHSHCIQTPIPMKNALFVERKFSSLWTFIKRDLIGILPWPSLD